MRERKMGSKSWDTIKANLGVGFSVLNAFDKSKYSRLPKYVQTSLDVVGHCSVAGMCWCFANV